MEVYERLLNRYESYKDHYNKLFSRALGALLIIQIIHERNVWYMCVANFHGTELFCKFERVSDEKREEILVSGVDDVVTILKSDYENAYFVTGTWFHIQNFLLRAYVREKTKNNNSIIRG